MSGRCTRDRLPIVDPCPVQLPDGSSCGRRSGPSMPFPICGQHARELFDHVNRFIGGITQDPVFRESLALDQLKAGQQRIDDWHRAREFVVYYIQIGEHIKIGYTSNLRTRLKIYPPTRRLLATEPGDARDEGRRHKQFQHLLHAGREWFRPGPDLIEHINELRRAQGAASISLTS